MRPTFDGLRHVPAGAAVVGLGVLWGSGFPAIRLVVTALPPLGAAGVRYWLAGCIVLAYARVESGRLLPETGAEWLAVSCVGVSVFGGYQAGLYLGTQYVSGAVAAVVTTMSPVVAAAVAVPVLGESRGLPDAVGFVLGLVGVVVLARPTVGATLSTTAAGVALVFAGTVLFACGSVGVQAFDTPLPAASLQGWAMLVGATTLLVGAAARGESVPAPGSVSPAVIAATAYVTFVAGAGGYLLYFRLLDRLGATETTLVAYVEPVGATAASALLLGETVGLPTVVGFLAVATGFTLVSRETVRAALADLGRDRTAS